MIIDRLRPTPSATEFIALTAVFNALLYHLPVFSFATRNLDVFSSSGVLTLVTLGVVMLSVTAFALVLLSLISVRILKPFCMLMALGNAVAVYFVVTYQVVLDKAMMGNVQNTDFAESFEYLHPTLLIYLLVLGVLPCWVLSRVRIRPTPRLRLAALASAGLVMAVIWAWLASSSWLWIDNNSRRLGGMVMPWSYVINFGRFEVPRLWASDARIPLPDATFASNEKTVVILVIGEAARAQDFELYGYDRPTNPLLTRAGVVALRNASSCSTYTTASLRCILSHVDSGSELSKRYEPLPSYLQRQGVDVIWRTGNWGEPPLEVESFEKAGDLRAACTGTGCNYDEVLLTGLEQRIRHSSSPRVFVVLHQSGSHGPAYHKKYPADFELFKPVCKSVELSKCSREELVNAYDNTILYTDYFLSRTIDVLKNIQDASTLLIYVSDHGESLGEYGLYLHGTPYFLSPDVQKNVPFTVWMSDEFMRRRGVDASRLASQDAHSQRDIFHTVMGAFFMHSDAYLSSYDIFSNAFSSK